MFWFGLRTELELLRREVDRLRESIRAYESTEVQRTAAALAAAAQLRTAAARAERAEARARAQSRSTPTIGEQLEDEETALVEAGDFRRRALAAIQVEDGEDDDGEEA